MTTRKHGTVGVFLPHSISGFVMSESLDIQFSHLLISTPHSTNMPQITIFMWRIIDFL